MNHLLNYRALNNRYFIIRHGQSLANQQGLIVSTPENGVNGYGLSDHGKAQVKNSLSQCRSISDVSCIISSDFKRAYETAQIALDYLQGTVADIVLEEALRERNFGDFELSKSGHYQAVWDADALDSTHTQYQVESAASVMSRVSQLILTLEERYTGQSILLVSHGDTLQILQIAFGKQPASTHRQLAPLETAEIRELHLAD
ncbi:histidine phosphatase family protein [Leucothrix pacifica]|uniref:Histidine phosphatase family protein n=1 Tax=Leucothrix pacifica TaxID=1247513 RepID=A0A317CNJ4_9GAMM|nr:histidine phosphatase family protein [Leucothrix pacifica]PWQ99899.1 histidine phosphatase family protein [Leucothrix pacifica]